MEHIDLFREYASTMQEMESVLAGNSRMYELYEERIKEDGKVYSHFYQSMFIDAGVDIDDAIEERIATLVSAHGVDASQIHVRQVAEDDVRKKLNNVKLWCSS